MKIGKKRHVTCWTTSERLFWTRFSASHCHPFFLIASTSFSIFLRFLGYVIATHAIGHDVIGQSDMKNESSRFEQPGTEVRLELACLG